MQTTGIFLLDAGSKWKIIDVECGLLHVPFEAEQSGRGRLHFFLHLHTSLEKNGETVCVCVRQRINRNRF